MNHILILLFLLLIISFLYFNNENFKDYKCVDLNKEMIYKNMLQYTYQFCTKYEIDYSIWFGTLLGYYRNKELIGFDGDIDIIINKKGINKLMELAKNLEINNVIFTNDLKNELKCNWKSNEIKVLVIYDKYYINCLGDKIDNYTDSCSIGMSKWGGGDLYARIIHNDINNNKRHVDFFYSKKYENELKKTKTDLLEDTKVKIIKNESKILEFFKKEYGKKWNISIKICDKKLKKWIKNPLY